MSTTFVRVSIASAAAATALTFNRPGYGEESEPLRNGDILIMFLGVGDRAGEAATLTRPEGWQILSGAASWDGVSSTRTFFAFKYITDIETEPTGYTFTYSASRALVGAVLAYRGVLRDVNFNPATYPYGFFAPYGSGQATVSTADNVLITGNVGAVFTSRRYCRVVRSVIFNHTANAPKLDDPTPLIPIRTRHNVAKVAMTIMDTEEVAITAQAQLVTVRSDANGQYHTVTITLEPIFDVASSFDNYKSKMIRSFFTPPYDPSLATPLGKLLAVIGTLDNDIGGLHGAADFLPDDPDGTL